MSKRPKISRPSVNLSTQENDQVFKLIGSKCQSLCTSVAQLYQTEGPHHSQWLKRQTGVVCFIKDNIRKSYYIRMFCLMKQELVWEHEMYEQIEIFQSKPFLLTFEGQNGMIALNFVTVEEAKDFYNIAMTTILERNRKREERKNQNKTSNSKSDSMTNQKPSNDSIPLRNTTNILNNETKTFQRQNLISKPQNKKKKFSKADISNPSDFRHISHVGGTSKDVFNSSGDFMTLRPFFEKAGISDELLNNRKTRNFIFDFIKDNNVHEIAKKEAMRSTPLPPIPGSNPNLKSRPLPPLPPNVHTKSTQNNKELPSEIKRPPVPPRPSINKVNMIGAVPAPPAPPPPPSLPMNMPPPSGHMKSAQPAVVVRDPRDELLKSIRNGAKLRKVEASSAPAASCVSNDPRNDLMNAIKAGKELRPVANLHKEPSRDSIGTDALADALNKALQKRRLILEVSSGSESDGDSDSWLE